MIKIKINDQDQDQNLTHEQATKDIHPECTMFTSAASGWRELKDG
jgi:hypothetical protein